MAREEPQLSPQLRDRLNVVLTLTHGGMVAEQAARAFWPLWTVLCMVAGALILGLQDLVPVEVVWAVGAVAGAMALLFVVLGLRRFRWPTRTMAMTRVDGTMKGRPFQTLLDRQVIGKDDAASAQVWQAHRQRMMKRLEDARTVRPDLRQNRADPFALRYVAVLTLAVALLFGSFGRVQSVTNMGLGGDGLAQGPAWEGWMQPPAYTRLPSVYLNDITDPELTVPEGAAITLRMYGQVGQLTVTEDVSGRDRAPDADPETAQEMASATAQDFEVMQSGRLAIEGPGGRAWQVAMVPDMGPSVIREGEIETSYEGETKIPFRGRDDHGVVTGVARFSLDLAGVDRRWGRTMDPETREVIEVPLPMPVAGDRTNFVEPLVANFSEHPWANLPVRLELQVEDARGQTALSQPEDMVLPGRRFFDPVAAALIEERQALLWNRAYAGDAAMILRAVLNRSDDLFRKDTQALTLRRLLDRIEVQARYGMTDEAQSEITQALWDLALELEEGDLEDARQRMQRAQERLEEAMKNGASDQEIAELMQELRDATKDYMRQLAQEQAKRGDQEGQPQNPQDMIEMSQDDIQRMMDKIQELMEQGRMAEAQEAMQQLQQMLENMQMTQGQGQGQSPGEQAMEGLSETLRDQQELSDEAFRELNQGQQGQQPGQQQQPGQGQEQGQQPGQEQGQQGQQGQDGQPGQGQGGDQSLSDSLAERQRSLRDELNRQRSNLPGQGTEAGEEAGRALDRAEGAMDGAEQALRDGELGEAIDQQSQALEALREGMRSLGEALAEQQQQGQQRSGEQGFAQGGDPQEQRDPLGRNAGTSGRTGTDEGLLQGEDVYRRADELLGELRKRSGETERPQVERDYLERLLERF